MLAARSVQFGESAVGRRGESREASIKARKRTSSRCTPPAFHPSPHPSRPYVERRHAERAAGRLGPGIPTVPPRVDRSPPSVAKVRERGANRPPARRGRGASHPGFLGERAPGHPSATSPASWRVRDAGRGHHPDRRWSPPDLGSTASQARRRLRLLGYARGPRQRPTILRAEGGVGRARALRVELGEDREPWLHHDAAGRAPLAPSFESKPFGHRGGVLLEGAGLRTADFER